MITEHNEYAERKWLHNSSLKIVTQQLECHATPPHFRTETLQNSSGRRIQNMFLRTLFLLIVFNFRGNNSMLVLSPSNETYLQYYPPVAEIFQFSSRLTASSNFVVTKTQGPPKNQFINTENMLWKSHRPKFGCLVEL